MSQCSSIEWTDTTWNPVVGCSKVSPGCAHCYAERMAKRLVSMAKSDDELGRNSRRKATYLNVINNRGRWNGNVSLVEDALNDPLQWRSSRFVFVNSMSDLFHDRVPDSFIHRVFDVMNRCP